MLRLLIVDDEAEVRDGYARFFPWEQMGFTVAGTAAGGGEALAFLSGESVDLMICDIKMPGMDGLGLVRAVRERYPAMEIIMLSCHSNFEYARQLMQYGVSAYVLKSEKHAVLIEALETVKKKLLHLEEAPGPRQDVIQAVQEYVRENLATASLQAAAERVHLNMTYLSRLFKERCGINFYAYVLERRMERAQALLLQPGRKVYDVADCLGYSDAKNFNRVFKQHKGISPREYQLRHRPQAGRGAQ